MGILSLEGHLDIRTGYRHPCEHRARRERGREALVPLSGRRDWADGVDVQVS